MAQNAENYRIAGVDKMKVKLFNTLIRLTEPDGTPKDINLYDLQDGEHCVSATGLKTLLRERIYGHEEGIIVKAEVERFMTVERDAERT